MSILPVATKPLTRVSALALTAQIRKAVDRTWELLLAAYEGQAHLALGYATWQAYVSEEFNLSRSQSYKLLDVGTVTRALKEATGATDDDPIQVSVREAIAVKGHIEDVKVEVAEAVHAGAKPQEAVKEAVSKRVPPKAAKPKPEPDPEAEAIEREEIARKSRVIPVNATPVLERVDVAYFIKGMDEMDPRAVARVITEREVQAHNRWWGSVIAARQELQPLSEARRQREAAERAKANAQ